MSQQKTLQSGEGVQLLCSKLKVGLSWDIFQGQQEVDLDASCVLFDEFGVIVDAAFYNQKETEDKSILHSGDCKDGKIDGDDESIIIDFTKMNQRVVSCFFS
jgi:tellurium resistance protein TerZ